MQYKSSSLSLWIKIRPAPQNSGWTSSEAGASPAILKMSRNNGAGRTWQGPVYKVLRRGKKRNGDDYEPEPLKIMQSAIERYLKEKNYALSIMRSREFHNSQEIQAAPSISSPKTTRRLNHNHRRNEGLTSLSQTTRIELWSRLFSLWLERSWILENCLSEWNVFFLCYARMSFCHMTS